MIDLFRSVLTYLVSAWNSERGVSWIEFLGCNTTSEICSNFAWWNSGLVHHFTGEVLSTTKCSKWLQALLMHIRIFYFRIPKIENWLVWLWRGTFTRVTICNVEWLENLGRSNISSWPQPPDSLCYTLSRYFILGLRVWSCVTAMTSCSRQFKGWRQEAQVIPRH